MGIIRDIVNLSSNNGNNGQYNRDYDNRGYGAPGYGAPNQHYDNYGCGHNNYNNNCGHNCGHNQAMYGAPPAGYYYGGRGQRRYERRMARADRRGPGLVGTVGGLIMEGVNNSKEKKRQQQMQQGEGSHQRDASLRVDDRAAYGRDTRGASFDDRDAYGPNQRPQFASSSRSASQPGDRAPPYQPGDRDSQRERGEKSQPPGAESAPWDAPPPAYEDVRRR